MNCTILLSIILTVQPFPGGGQTNHHSGEELTTAQTAISDTADGVGKPCAQTALYLVHSGRGFISETAIISLFRSGWSFQHSVEILGYTATDDLWTVIGTRNSSPPASYSKVKIVLTSLKENTPEWANCTRDIYRLSQRIPKVIVLEGDPG